ncbi:MAG: 2,5-diketo-D-gluconate reductase A [Firmicutes bacterium ADurb.Bin419]|nr:MAG: 2,5-diketo-D-gluconate reductase A [Firmicutes bacterium ADurb.Bin419]
MKELTKLCFGTLPMAYFQNNLSINQGAELIRYAIKKGIDFFDTAELYQTYDIIREGIKGSSDKVKISTKTHANNYKDAKQHVETALNKLERNYIDIFYIHAPKVENPFVVRADALQCLLEYKSKGVIKHIGIASHRVDTIWEAADSEYIDVVFALINLAGIGIMAGTKEDMECAIDYAYKKNKQVVAMKVLGGGNLIKNAEKAIDYVLRNPSIQSAAVGMVSKQEIDINYNYFNNIEISNSQWEEVKHKQRGIRILNFCKGCMKCTAMCSANAIQNIDGKAVVDRERCTLCGYCAANCPNFSIRIS